MLFHTKYICSEFQCNFLSLLSIYFLKLIFVIENIFVALVACHERWFFLTDMPVMECNGLCALITLFDCLLFISFIIIQKVTI